MKKLLALGTALAFISFLMSLSASNDASAVVNFIAFIITLVYAISNEEFVLKNNKFLLVVSIIMFAFNIFYTTAIMIAILKTDFSKKEVEVVDPHIKKINNLLRLGITMIIASGLIFVTSGWNNIGDGIKVLLLFIASLLFLGLYKFVKQRLNLSKSAKSYWIIGNALLVITLLAVGILGLLGSWFSLSGPGSSLYLSCLFLMSAAICYETSLEFENEELLYGVYSLLLLSISCIVHFLTKEVSIAIMFVSLIDFYLSYFKFEKIKDNFVFTLSYLTPILFIAFIRTFTNNFVLIITGALLLFNLLYPVFFKKDLRNVKYISPYMYAIMCAVAIYFFDNIKIDSLLVYLALHIAYFSILYFKEFRSNISAVIFTTVLTNFGLLVLYLGHMYGNTYDVIMVSAAMILVNIISLLLFSKKEFNMEKYFLPIKTLLASCSFAIYLSNYIVVEPMYFITLLSIVYIIMYIFIKDNDIKKMNLLFILLASLIGIFTRGNIIGLEFIFTAIIAGYSVFVYKENKIDRDYFYPLYVVSLFNIYALINSVISLVDVTHIIFIITALLSLLLFEKNRIMQFIVGVILLIPTTNLAASNLFANLDVVVMGSYILAFVHFFTKEMSDQKNAEQIRNASFVLVLLVATFGGIICSLYVGVVSLLLMFFGFNEKKSNWRFKTGLVFTIFNIIYNLKDLLSEIPLWAYLLLAGISIIGFVTYNEIEKKDK